MSYTYKITEAKKAHHVRDNYDFMDVGYDVLDDSGEKIGEFRSGFPIGTDEDTIRKELELKAQWCEDRAERELAGAEKKKLDDGTNAVIGSLMKDVKKGDPKKKAE